MTGFGKSNGKEAKDLGANDRREKSDKSISLARNICQFTMDFGHLLPKHSFSNPERKNRKKS